MSFYTEVIQADPRSHSTAPCRDMTLLEPATRDAVMAIIAEAAAIGIDLRISETYRSPARQKQLFESGATQLEHVGVHGYGLACDFYISVNGKAVWDGDWSFLGDLARKHGMVWGGEWTGFPDRDHVQRCAVHDQARLFAGTWYPDTVAA